MIFLAIRRHSQTHMNGYYPGITPVDNGIQNAAVWVIPGQKWMDWTEVVRGTFPNLKSTRYSIPCQMCQNAPCVAAGKNGDVTVRPDGIILIDPILSSRRLEPPSSMSIWQDLLEFCHQHSTEMHVLCSLDRPRTGSEMRRHVPHECNHIRRP